MAGENVTIEANQFLRLGTLPAFCPSPQCNEFLTLENATVQSESGYTYRLQCPDCEELIDQACPDCGSKDFQIASGIEECLLCGHLVKVEYQV
jgi:Zn finger protein HypA/HybF involved in hydrogenase expression